MNSTSLDTLAAKDMARAKEHNSGRSAHTVYGGQGSALRRLGAALCGGGHVEGCAGGHVVVPQTRHDLGAVEDAVVLLTVAVHDGAGT